MARFQTKEYARIKGEDGPIAGNGNPTDTVLPKSAFESLWGYILELQGKNPSIEKAFKMSTKGGKGIIQVQNYVGTIETPDGNVVEILPKIFSGKGELDIKACKRILLQMLSVLMGFPYISFQQASLEAERDFPILEVFIKTYIEEAESLVVKGLRKDYQFEESNGPFLKGQLVFSKNILKNLFDKSKFYTRFTQYRENIPQNRIIKSALLKLFGLSKLIENKSRLTYLLSLFAEIPASINIDNDLTRCKGNNRLFAHYVKILEWSELFLSNKGFTAFSGNSANQAMLFPMEKLFESFAAYHFKMYAKSYLVHTQHQRHFLVDTHGGKGKFKLKPDLFLEAKDASRYDLIIDTKWKMVHSGKSEMNYLISQGDMYQLYAYGKKYSESERAPRLLLLYPMNSNFKNELEAFYYDMRSQSGSLKLKAVPFDLSGDIESQVLTILGSSGEADL